MHISVIFAIVGLTVAVAPSLALPSRVTRGEGLNWSFFKNSRLTPSEQIAADWRAEEAKVKAFSTTSAWRTINSLHTFSEEEDLLRESVKRFAQDVVRPKVREMDENELMDSSVVKGLFEQGLMGIETSAEHGGAGSSFTSAIIEIEELAKVDPSVSVLCDVHNTLVNTVIRKYGTSNQKERWLPQLAESKARRQLGSFCLSEPASGSDAFALQTRATRGGDNWIINGSKMWITNSYEADVFLIFANIDPSKSYKGITCFVATRDMGIQIAKKEQKLGIRASSTCTLNFDDWKVPAENVIGGEGSGYKIAIEILNEAQMVGLAQGAFDKAVPYTYERKQFGQPVGTFQGMAFQIAQAAIDLESAQLLTYNAARRKEERRSFTKEAAMAKYWASVVAQQVSGQAIEWAGGVGFTRETGIEKFWRDSKIGAIYEGTSNIQLQTISKFIQKEYS
ncbi:acyl-CoA oxidase [Russula earlei]|uniref:Acyl-CoA oxidase n=1 Tax=Russula earlei TaxID=71964 RepID=A0ACC0U7K3_9AGAM|nr:acyl-CoA oxidase [Russula earlei]